MFFNQNNEFNDIIINTGKTVAIPTIDIAAKGNPKQIILVGQDLAFVNNKTHTDSFNETYKILNITNDVEGDFSSYKKVEGVNGDMLYTKSEYLNFKHFIELELQKYPQIEFINCSSGAKIKGTRVEKLDAFIKS